MMKNKFKLLIYLFVGILAIGCSEDDGAELIDIAAPTNVDAQFTIAQDNSGEVTITPSATNADYFIVEFGDGSGSSESTSVGDQIIHTYDQGSYEVKVIAFNATGETAQITKTLEVSFAAPQNLQVTITQDEASVNVAATADLAMSFSVDFGDDSDLVTFGVGETVDYTYTEEGTYTITVTAMSGSPDTISYTEEITIEAVGDPVNTDVSLPLTFEGAPETYVFTEFEGAPTTVVANPDMNGNPSAQVAQTERVQGAANYAAAFIDLVENPALADNNQLTMKVWSPAAGIPVTLRFEDPTNANAGVEAAATTTVANQWETLTFDYTGIVAGQDYSRMIVFFNLGTDGQGNIYYFDDIEYGDGEGSGGAGTGNIVLPLDFEQDPENYVFTEFEGAPTFVVANPDMNGNPSAQVAQTDRAQGALNYAAAFIDLDEAPDFSNNTQITVKVWSPAVGIPVTLKFENPSNANDFVEVAGNTTVANQWETLTLNYSGVAAGAPLTRLVVFFNLGTDGQGNTYYFDDIQLQ
jgi:hypothetical protein